MTLKECLDCCQDEGILRVEPLLEEEYVDQEMGFKPRLFNLRKLAKSSLFFSFFPFII